jgi:signal transduction histidine kinase
MKCSTTELRLRAGDRTRCHYSEMPYNEAAKAGLFQPFTRGPHRANQQGLGLGLGLYIASEIAKAHGGALEVASTPAETRFTFRMPRALT